MIGHKIRVHGTWPVLQQIRQLTGFDGSTAPLEPFAKRLLRRSVVSFCMVQRLTLGERLGIVLGQSGRGKSTLFNLMGGYDAGHLHDDKIILWDNRAWSLPAESSNTHPSQVVPQAIKHCGYQC